MAGTVYTDADIAQMDAQVNSAPTPTANNAPKTYTDADIAQMDAQSPYGKNALNVNAGNPKMIGGQNSPALIDARGKQAQADVNDTGPTPYINAVGNATVRTPSLLTTVPSSIASNLQKGTPQNIVPDLGKVVTGQESPDYGTVLKGAGVPDTAAKIGGTAMDVALYPGGAKGAVDLAKLGVDATGNAINGTFNKAKNFVGDLITGPEKAQAAGEAEKFALGQKTAQQIEDTQRIGKYKINIAKTNADAASKGYDDLSDTLKKQVAKYSDKQGQDLQENLPKIFGQKSSEYGKEQGDIIKNLPENRKNIPVDKVVNDMEQTLIKFKILKNDGSGNMVTTDAELTPTEHKVLGIYKDLKGSINPIVSDSPIVGENGRPFQNVNVQPGTIHVDDLIKNQKYIEPDYGKAFEPDDKLKSEISQGFSKNISDAVPELKALRTKYAPFLQWKQAAIDNFKPFNSQYDVATGTVGKQGSSELDPSGQRLMAKLQQVYQSPYGAKINALNKGIKATMLNKEQAAQAASEGIQKLRTSLANDIRGIRQGRTLTAREIDMKTNQLVTKYKNNQRLASLGIGGITLSGGGSLLEYFIRRNAYKGLSGG